MLCAEKSLSVRVSVRVRVHTLLRPWSAQIAVHITFFVHVSENACAHVCVFVPGVLRVLCT